MPVLVETDMTFSERLRELKEESGLSWPAIAKAANISQNSLNDYAHRGKVPSALVLFRLAKAIGVSCDAFSECDQAEPEPKKKGKK